MYCPSCGTDLPDNARFCGKCRHQIDTASNNAQVVDAPHQQQAEVANFVGQNTATVEVTPVLKWGVVAGTLIMPLIGLVMGLIYLLSASTAEKKSVGKMWLIVGGVMSVIWMLYTSNTGVVYY